MKTLQYKVSSVHKFTISLFSTFKTLAFAAILCIDIVSTTISTIICTFRYVIDIITIVISNPSLVTAYSELETNKGQLISKYLFVDFNFFQKTNENTSCSSKNEFICSFFGRIHDLTICFRN